MWHVTTWYMGQVMTPVSIHILNKVKLNFLVLKNILKFLKRYIPSTPGCIYLSLRDTALEIYKYCNNATWKTKELFVLQTNNPYSLYVYGTLLWASYSQFKHFGSCQNQRNTKKAQQKIHFLPLFSRFSLFIKPSQLFALSQCRENICWCNQSNELKLHVAVSGNTHLYAEIG